MTYTLHSTGFVATSSNETVGHRLRAMWNGQTRPLGLSQLRLSKARYSQSHLGWHFGEFKAQSSQGPFATFQWKETIELWALSFELWNNIRKCHPKWDRLYMHDRRNLMSTIPHWQTSLGCHLAMETTLWTQVVHMQGNRIYGTTFTNLALIDNRKKERIPDWALQYRYSQQQWSHMYIGSHIYIYWLMLHLLLRQKESSSFAGSSMCSISINIYIYQKWENPIICICMNPWA